MNKTAKKPIIRRSDEEKIALIEKWESSGLPITVFCNQHDFSDSLFHSWLNKYRRNKKKVKPSAALVLITSFPIQDLHLFYYNLPV